MHSSLSVSCASSRKIITQECCALFNLIFTVLLSLHHFPIHYLMWILLYLRIGGMGVLLSITMVKSFFGGKYLINTEYWHKKHFSLILTVSRGKNSLEPKIGSKKKFFLNEYSCAIYHWNQKNMLILKMNVTLALILTFCYFMKSNL